MHERLQRVEIAALGRLGRVCLLVGSVFARFAYAWLRLGNRLARMRARRLLVFIHQEEENYHA